MILADHHIARLDDCLGDGRGAWTVQSGRVDAEMRPGLRQVIVKGRLLLGFLG